MLEKNRSLIFCVIAYFLVYIVITVLMSTVVAAGGLVYMGYSSRGESMLGY
jgi:hypothetical protein